MQRKSSKSIYENAILDSFCLALNLPYFFRWMTQWDYFSAHTLHRVLGFPHMGGKHHPKPKHSRVVSMVQECMLRCSPSHKALCVHGQRITVSRQSPRAQPT